MKVADAIAVIIAAVIIACSPEPATLQTQPTSTTATTANQTATTAITAAPVAQTTAEAAAPTLLDPTEGPTPTTIHTSEIKLLKVAVAEIPSNLPNYDRHDWKHWTDADGDCQDARNEVLIAESKTTVSFRTDKRCRVVVGQWLAPYTGSAVTNPRSLDIDHMVPLGNAHASGAWNWSAEQREHYANHLGDPQHLIAVTASANRSKGARGPEEWKPADQAYWCQYAIDWITIKDNWDLTVTLREIDALTGMLDTCANPPNLLLSQGGKPVVPRPTNGSHYPTPTPTARTYSSCDAAQVAGESRVQGSQGGGRGFSQWMVPSARDGDGDGVVCEK